MSVQVCLHPLGIEHLTPYLDLVNSFEVHKTTQPLEEFEEYTESQIVDWLNSRLGHQDRRDFAILDTDSREFLGEVVLNHIAKATCNLRIAILPKYWDRGFGTKAIGLAVLYAFEELKLDSVTLGVFSNNLRGLRVYEKCGFVVTSREPVGKGLFEIQMEVRRNIFEQ